MSGYEEDHNLPAYENARPRPTSQPRRPDLSTFYSILASTDTDDTHTEPMPGDVAALYRLQANALQITLGESEGVAAPQQQVPGAQVGGEGLERLQAMVEELMQQADNPPRQIRGMPDMWFDQELERVPKKSLKPGDVCGLCFTPHLDDKYPLVVRLPCHEKHIFDYECIRPWLKTHTTCPFCRVDLAKKKEQPVQKDEDDAEQDEFDGLYA